MSRWSRLRGGGDPSDGDRADVASDARALATQIAARGRGHRFTDASVDPRPDDPHGDELVAGQTIDKDWMN